LSAPGTKSRRGAASPALSVRLGSWARVEAHASGAIVAVFQEESANLGKFGASALHCLEQLRTGVPLASVAPGSQNADKEIELLVRRLALYGLLEYRIGRPDNGLEDLIVIEPQVAGYWPHTPTLADTDMLALSRFAYLRRRGNEMVLESPRAGALFRICEPRLVSLLASLSVPQQVKQLRKQDDFPGIEFLALLADCKMAFKANPASGNNPRLEEGDQDLALWDFHDLLFHTRSTEGRHANPAGGVYPHGGLIPPLPALRPSWRGKTIDLLAVLDSNPDAKPAIAKLFRESRSTRSYDDRKPITLAELSQFLDGAARGLPRERNGTVDYIRPYPSAGASSELELYLSVHACDGLAPGFYHYDAGAHALAAIDVPAAEVKKLLSAGGAAMGETSPPQILITITARFGRVSWKYSSIAYALILKDAGVFTETLYLMAAGMGLGACAIGLANIDQFEKMTGVGFYVEGPVAQFAIGSLPAPKNSH
jgi:SagB-type dehydrogenase family enzyme